MSQMRLADEKQPDLIPTLELAPGESLSERWVGAAAPTSTHVRGSRDRRLPASVSENRGGLRALRSAAVA